MQPRFAVIALLMLAAPALAKGHRHSEPVIPDSVEVRETHRDEWADYLRLQRQIQIDRLSAYSAAGVFPVNLTGQTYAHQLLDANGTPCAMAYLVQTSGGGDLIAKTAQSDNALLMAEQTSGPFAEWIRTSGLTREEVAIIQFPGFTMGDYDSEYEVPQIALTDEQIRMQSHFVSAITLLQADTEPSIDLALARLGDDIYRLPPGY